jgi:hypothetical protein
VNLNGNRPEVEAGALRDMLLDMQTVALAEGSVGLANKIGLTLNRSDLGELTCNQIRELREKNKELKALVEAQSLGLNSLSRQLRFFREFRDMALPLLERMSPFFTDDELCAKVKNLMTAQYDGHSTWRDLLEMATVIELIPGRIKLVKCGECWRIENGHLSDESFPSVEAAYSWFLQFGADMVEAVKQ